MNGNNVLEIRVIKNGDLPQKTEYPLKCGYNSSPL